MLIRAIGESIVIIKLSSFGGLAESGNAAVLKTVRGLNLSGVRISYPPQLPPISEILLIGG